MRASTSVRHIRRVAAFAAAAGATFVAPTAFAAPNLITGPDSGLSPAVNAYAPPTYAPAGSFLAFASTFTGGVRVASADFTGDGVPDTVAGSGPGALSITGAGGSEVRIFNGSTNAQLTGPLAPNAVFGQGYTGGLYVAAGDVNGDGTPDVVVSAGSRVRVLSGTNATPLADFFAYDGFTGNVRVAAGDVNGDGRADIVTVPGNGGAARVRVFSGADGSVLRDFFAYDQAFTGGAFVAAADVNGDGRADLVTGPDTGGGANVKVFDGNNPATVLASFFAFDSGSAAGARVAAGDVNGDGRAELFAAQGPGGAGLVRGFDGTTTVQLASFQPYGNVTNGAFVAVAPVVPEPATLGALLVGGVLTRRARRG